MVAAVVYAADQVTKILAVALLEPGEVVAVLGQLLQLRLVRNPGAAFSFATGATWVFTLIAVVVVVAVLRVARRLGSRSWAVALGLLLAGALGNLTDRLLRSPGVARGHVVDFLELPNWPIFNLADCAICAAAGLVVILAVRGTDVDGEHGPWAPAPSGAHAADPVPLDPDAPAPEAPTSSRKPRHRG